MVESLFYNITPSTVKGPFSFETYKLQCHGSKGDETEGLVAKSTTVGTTQIFQMETFEGLLNCVGAICIS